MADKSKTEHQNTRGKEIGLFIGKTVFYFAILVVQVSFIKISNWKDRVQWLKT